jgi:hypothetical protein
MHALEIAFAALGQDTDEIYHNFSILHDTGDIGFRPRRGVKRDNITASPHGTQEHGGFCVPHRDTHDIAARRQTLHDMPA